MEPSNDITHDNQTIAKPDVAFFLHGDNGFVTATKSGTTNTFFVAATKNFAAATKCYVDRTKHFVVVTKYFCYSFFNKLFCWYNKTLPCGGKPLPLRTDYHH